MRRAWKCGFLRGWDDRRGDVLFAIRDERNARVAEGSSVPTVRATTVPNIIGFGMDPKHCSEHTGDNHVSEKRLTWSPPVKWLLLLSGIVPRLSSVMVKVRKIVEDEPQRHRADLPDQVCAQSLPDLPLAQTQCHRTRDPRLWP